MNNPFSFLGNIYMVNNSSKLQELLKNPATRLDDVLDEEALVSDFVVGKAHVLEL
jgi:hypothetical protein